VSAPPKGHQIWIAVAHLEVSKNLIVGFILFHNEEHMVDSLVEKLHHFQVATSNLLGGIFADCAVSIAIMVSAKTVVLSHLPRQRFQFFWCGDRNEARPACMI